MRWAWSVGAIALIAGLLSGCGGDEAKAVIDPGDGGNYSPEVDPSRFVERIDNPYLPFKPGNVWVYESDDGNERIEVEVLTETRVVMGITATVVRDTVTEDGELVEDTRDWYAQDLDGNVWYLGEETAEYEDGKVVSTAGAWEAGIDGAKPGIVMLAQPTVGRAYRQEYYQGEAEDMARVDRIGDEASTPAGSFAGLVVITEWTPLEADIVEEKFYAEGVGVVQEVKVKGEEGRVVLVSFTEDGGRS
jgi:hypothetical protein